MVNLEIQEKQLLLEKEISNFHEHFYYKVNNLNTPKNLKLLSKMYFGSELFAEKIKIHNKLSLDDLEIIPQDFEVLIPNFK